jgi:hypothetical protein
MKRAIIIGGLLSLITFVTACEQGTNTGYYDGNGNYVPTDTPYNMRTGAHSPMPGGNDNVSYDRENNRSEYQHYTRRGYYNHDGYYMAKDSGIKVDKNMFPPRGMCRVWFANTIASEQPDIESCDDIRQRVPAGAYVIYGG